MKRVLLFSFYFPPQAEAGALRSGYLADHIGSYGWQPTVLTAPYASAPAKTYRVVLARSFFTPALRARREPGRSSADSQRSKSKLWSLGVRHALAKVYYRLSRYWYPDPAVGWIGDALYKAFTLHRELRFSLVFSTAWPASAHVAAAAFCAATGVPWVADYRDLWTGYPYRSIGSIRRLVDRTVERRLLRGAAAITTVSMGLGTSLAALHQRDDVEVIPNAASDEDWEAVPDYHPEQFNVLYAGLLYGGQRTPDLLFAAAAELRAQGDPAGLAVTFDFYGAERDLVLSAARRYGIDDSVRVHDRKDHPTILHKERAAAVLLILLKMDPLLRNEYGSKLYEYAGARRPILAVGPQGSVVADYLRQSGLGILVWSKDLCKIALKAMYDNYCQARFAPEINPGWKTFSSSDLASRFAAVFDRSTERPSRRRDKV